LYVTVSVVLSVLVAVIQSAFSLKVQLMFEETVKLKDPAEEETVCEEGVTSRTGSAPS